jgi:hypothetical protein
MKQFEIVVLLVIADVLLCACPDKNENHRYINFINKSAKDIVCQEIYGNGLSTKSDTLFHCRLFAIAIQSETSHVFECDEYASGWEKDLEDIPYLQFIVMDMEIYDQYIAEPCDTIRKYVPVLHRYQLTLEDLQRMNWTVIYPQEE